MERAVLPDAPGHAGHEKQHRADAEDRATCGTGHEIQRGVCARAGVLADTHQLANGTQSGGTLGLLEDYYAFEWGEALFIMLDPFWNTNTNPNSANDSWKWSLGKAQYDWLRDTLKNSSARYKFVFMHHIVGGSTQAIIGGVPTPQYAARGGIEVSDKYEWGGKNADGSPGFATIRR